MEGLNKQDTTPALEKKTITTHEGGEAVHEQNNEDTQALFDKADALLAEAQEHKDDLSPETAEKVERLTWMQKFGLKKKTEGQKVMLAKADFAKFLEGVKFGITKDTEAAKEKVRTLVDLIANDTVLQKYAAEYGYNGEKTIPGYLEILKKGISDVAVNPAILTKCVEFTEEGKTDRLIKFLRRAGHSGYKNTLWNEETQDFDSKGTNVSGSFIAS